HPRSARAVVDDDLLAEDLAELRAEEAREQVGRAALRYGRDEADRLRRKSLRRRRRDAGEREQQDGDALREGHGFGGTTLARLGLVRNSGRNTWSSCSFVISFFASTRS